VNPRVLPRAGVAAFILVTVIGAGAGTASAASPTCAGTLGITNHGQHIVGDYVTGTGHAGWPPSGGVVGDAVRGGGAAVPGGPGPGFHFPNGFAPGASFCTASSAPGIHL
jgi:hypothetical protein